MLSGAWNSCFALRLVATLRTKRLRRSAKEEPSDLPRLPRSTPRVGNPTILLLRRRRWKARRLWIARPGFQVGARGNVTESTGAPTRGQLVQGRVNGSAGVLLCSGVTPPGGALPGGGGFYPPTPPPWARGPGRVRP